MSRPIKGLALGLLGVIIFAATLPVTKLAMSGPGMSPVFIWAGRATIAGILSGIYLWASGARWPGRDAVLPIGLVMLGVVIAWPLMSSLAMMYSTPAHLAVLNGVLPFVTAALGAWLLKDRQPARFWICAALGSCVVSLYAYSRADGAWQLADGLMAIGIIVGGLGYIGGAMAARFCSGPQAISWGLLFSLPFTLPAAFLTFDSAVLSSPALPWLAFVYLALMSQWIGFFFWYQALQVGGVARVSQVQLLQLFITLGFAAILAGDQIDASLLVVAVLTVALIAIGRRQ